MKKLFAILLCASITLMLVPCALLADQTTGNAGSGTIPCEHKYVFSSIKEAPTHLTEGILIYICELCHDAEERKLPPIETHEFGYFTTYSKTQHRRICECGAAEYEDHTYGEWKTEKHPTEEASGLEKHTCTVCGAVETRVIPALTPETTTATPEATTEETTAETTTAETTTAESTTAQTTTATTVETTTVETTTYDEPIEEPYSTLVWVCVAIAAGIIACVIATIAITIAIIKKRKAN